MHVELGRVSGLYGVRGWVKVFSYTEPRDNILQYPAWLLGMGGSLQRFELAEGRPHGKVVVARLGGLEDREEARQWIGASIFVERDALPRCDPGEYYWTDLEGLEVCALDGQRLGRVDYLVATGANDVIVLAGPGMRMIPFIPGVVRQVDLAAGTLLVDWEFAKTAAPREAEPSSSAAAQDD